MIYKFSEAFKDALENAENLAISLGHKQIGTEHILYGMVKAEKGLAFKMLEKQNIDASQIKESIKEKIGEGPIKLLKTEGFTPKAKKVIENSLNEMEKNFLNNIGTETILLSILNNRENMAFQILIELHVDIDRLYEDLLTMISQVEELNKEKKNKSKLSGR